MNYVYCDNCKQDMTKQEPGLVFDGTQARIVVIYDAHLYGMAASRVDLCINCLKSGLIDRNAK